LSYLHASPGSNISLQIKRKVKRLKEELKKQGKPIKYGHSTRDYENMLHIDTMKRQKYHCQICDRNHYTDTDIGKKHFGKTKGMDKENKSKPIKHQYQYQKAHTREEGKKEVKHNPLNYVTTNIKDAKGYEGIIKYLINMAKVGNKNSAVSYTEKNPNFSTNFWRLYKKEAKNKEMQELFNFMFPKAKVSKAPNGLWKFYYNEYPIDIGNRYSKYIYMKQIAEDRKGSTLTLETIEKMSYEELIDYAIDLERKPRKKQLTFQELLAQKK